MLETMGNLPAVSENMSVDGDHDALARDEDSDLFLKGRKVRRVHPSLVVRHIRRGPSVVRRSLPRSMGSSRKRSRNGA